jgi:hypothetical protein
LLESASKRARFAARQIHRFARRVASHEGDDVCAVAQRDFQSPARISMADVDADYTGHDGLQLIEWTGHAQFPPANDRYLTSPKMHTASDGGRLE